MVLISKILAQSGHSKDLNKHLDLVTQNSYSAPDKGPVKEKEFHLAIEIGTISNLLTFQRFAKWLS